MASMDAADYLVIGAGAAGAVLASRLTEDPRARVIVVEAGRDVEPGREPADITSLFPLSTFNPAYAWPDLSAHWLGVDDSPALPFAQGRVVGGSSTIMGMWALRGVPDDYDSWVRAGALGWSWSDVLPYFRKLESDQDFAGPLHGREGPLPIRRQPRSDWAPFASAVEAAASRCGFEEVADMNADFADGHCRLPLSRSETGRASAGLCYLTPAVRARENLRLLSRTTVERLRFEGRRAVGAIARREDGQAVTLSAGETILAAGAIHSPTLLMRSGVGPERVLRDSGVALLECHPGIGANLQNHPLLPVLAFLERPGRDPPGDRPTAATYLRWTSGLQGTSPGDMGLYIRSYLIWHALGRRMAMLAPVLMKPASRGRVALDRNGPDRPPLVAFDFLSDERDLVRLIAGFRLALTLFAAPELKGLCGPAFQLPNSGRLDGYNALNRRNAVVGRLAATCLDLWPALLRALFTRLAEPRWLGGDPARSKLADDTVAGALVRGAIAGTSHVCGTCRIGLKSDSGAVVDPEGRLYRLEGLRVADASIMPGIPSGNTHLPTVMVAEKIADSIRGRRSRALNGSSERAAKVPATARRSAARPSGT